MDFPADALIGPLARRTGFTELSALAIDSRKLDPAGAAAVANVLSFSTADSRRVRGT